MSANADKATDVVKLDTETILLTGEGRIFLNQINQVSRVLSLKDSEVQFKGEEVVKTGYVGDFKSVQLFECPRGYFLFCNNAFSRNNWSATGESADDVIGQVESKEVKKKLTEALSESAETAP